MVHGSNFVPLLIVALLAVAVPLVVQRVLRGALPIVVGEIIAGMAVGKAGQLLLSHVGLPHWAAGLAHLRFDGAELLFLKTFGFAYLMFLSGLEVDFDLLRPPMSRGAREEGARPAVNPIWPALGSFVLTLLLSLGLAYGLALLGLAKDVLIMALILSTTSLGVVMPVLKERGLLGRELGQHILVASIVGDFATVALISIYVIFRTDGLTFEMLLILILVAAAFLVYRLAEMFRRATPLERIVDTLSHATGQLDTRVALALALVFIALAEGLGVEAILGAFLAGTIVSLMSREEGSSLRFKLNALGYGFFIPIFFIMVGLEFDLAAVIGSREGLILVPALLAIAFAVKLVAALVYRWLFSWRETIALGVLTSARLSLIIAVAAVGVEIGAITSTTNAAIILVAISTVVLAPAIFNRLVPSFEEKHTRVLIVAGRVPFVDLLAQRLAGQGDAVAVVTAVQDVHHRAKELGLEAVLVQRDNFLLALKRAGVERAKAVVCLLDDERKNQELALTINRYLEVDNVIAHVKSEQVAKRLKRAGVSVVEPTTALMVTLEALVRTPHAFSILVQTEGEWHVEVVTIDSSALDGRALRDITFPGDSLVLAIARDGEVVVPKGGTRLRSGDRVTLVGARDAVLEAKSMLSE